MYPKLYKLVVVLLALLVAPHLHAYDFKVDGLCYNLISKDNPIVEVTFLNYYSNYAYCAGNLVIPSEVSYNGKVYSVVSIGEHAFFYCSHLTSVAIPSSVVTIEEGAFSQCSRLTSVTIPSSVSEINRNVFVGCNKLKIIDVDEHNASFTSLDGVLYSKDLTRIIRFPEGMQGSYSIPNTVTTIGYGAFYSCDGLTGVTIPTSVIIIDDHAFGGCHNLTSVHVPNHVSSIGSFAFSNCSNLTLVSIPNSVTEIGQGAFADSPNIREIFCHWDSPIACKPPIGQTPQINQTVYKLAVLYVPQGCKSAYEKVDPWMNFWNIEEKDYSGIDVASADEISVSVADGVINVGNAGTDTPVEVFDLQGRRVYQGHGNAVAGLGRGVYLLRVGSRTVKVKL